MTIRQIRVEGDIAYVPLTKGYEAIIDVADVPLVEGANWYAQADCRADGSIRTIYAVRTAPLAGKQTAVRMHRALLGSLEGVEVDHRDSDGLNNRRLNLREASKAQNQQNRRISIKNSTGKKGVDFHKATGKYRARIRLNGRRHYLGAYATPEAAHEAYTKASNELHGQFGRTS